MKRISLIGVCAIFIFMLSGCNGFYHSIERDTVMVKKINKERMNRSVEYNSALSEQSVKTLSINAVNKYFNLKLTNDDMMIELVSMNQKQLNNVLIGTNEQPRNELSISLNRLSGGLTFAHLEVPDTGDNYQVVINPLDGDVVSIINDNPQKVRYKEPEPELVDRTKTIQIANLFLAKMEGSAASDFELDMDSIHWGMVTELYYKSKGSDSTLLSITMLGGQVIGFDKDAMGLMQSKMGVSKVVTP